ncbi:uncharacterized protein LOC114828391 [Galendromus occidentalis]|uniref:Uncharacterized protein LOC114828391 n=1 Tax=Galendromus occidentalis TaxID=34638 RepID=A0AAJ7SG86_9ACAR|nr:uncharacterized protein LOC114828391 [Galendromus occidentalis]
MELYVYCLVCVMVLGVVVINGIYCVMYLSYPLPGGLEPCPPLAKLRRKSRSRPSPRTRSPLRTIPRKGSAEVMIPMSQYDDDIDTRLQPVVESPPIRLQHQQSTPRKKSGRSSSPRTFTPTRSTSPPRSINQSSISITPPLARSNTPTRPTSSRMKYGQTEI